MSKIRVHELSKELNVESKDLIKLLMDEFNIEVKNGLYELHDRLRGYTLCDSQDKLKILDRLDNRVKLAVYNNSLCFRPITFWISEELLKKYSVVVK